MIDAWTTPPSRLIAITILSRASLSRPLRTTARIPAKASDSAVTPFPATRKWAGTFAGPRCGAPPPPPPPFFFLPPEPSSLRAMSSAERFACATLPADCLNSVSMPSCVSQRASLSQRVASTRGKRSVLSHGRKPLRRW